MSTLESRIAIRDIACLDSTKGCDPEGVFATTASDKKALAERWNAIVDRPLIEWGLNPSFTDEDGLEFPSKKACASAVELAAYLRDDGGPLPTGVIPDGEGGIVFENKQDPSYQCFEIDENGLIVLLTFRDCKLRSKHNIEL